MKYFIDTEFIEDGKTIDLISIGIIAENGKELYLQNVECRLQLASEWIYRNVYPTLSHFSMKDQNRSCRASSNSGSCSDPNCQWYTKQQIKNKICNFIGNDKTPEFWGYYCDYDWVVFCQLFGTMMDLPEHFPKFCLDLKQSIYHSDMFWAKEQTAGLHNALEDARWIKDTWVDLYQTKDKT